MLGPGLEVGVVLSSEAKMYINFDETWLYIRNLLLALRARPPAVYSFAPFDEDMHMFEAVF